MLGLRHKPILASLLLLGIVLYSVLILASNRWEGWLDQTTEYDRGLQFSNALVKEQIGRREERPILVNIWSQLSRSTGVAKLLNLRKYNPACHGRKPEKLCKWTKIEDCDIPCTFTADPKLISVSDIVLFHFDKWNPSRDPIPFRESWHRWAMFGHEPIWKKRERWMNPFITKHFDLSFHWGTGADVPVTYFYFDDFHYLHPPGLWWNMTDVYRWREILPPLWNDVHEFELEYFSKMQIPRTKEASTNTNNTTEMTTEYREFNFTHFNLGRVGEDSVSIEDIALVSMMISGCASRARNAVLTEIMEKIPVASFGGCLKNADGDMKHKGYSENLTEDFRNMSWRDPSVLLMEQKVDIIQRYPFHLAMESTSEERGFITEKIFQCFRAGVIPIYYGHQEIVEMMPPKSLIYMNGFDSVSEMVRYVKTVASNISLYMEFHEWRNHDDADAYFEVFRRRSRTSAACRLCKASQRAPALMSAIARRENISENAAMSRLVSPEDSSKLISELPEGYLVYSRQYGWNRQARDSDVFSLYARKSVETDPGQAEKYLMRHGQPYRDGMMPHEAERLKLDRLARASKLKKNLTMVDEIGFMGGKKHAKSRFEFDKITR